MKFNPTTFALAALSPIVQAEQVTVPFAGTVAYVTGPNAGAFQLGEMVTGLYVLETNVPDLVPGNPNEGRYRNSVVTISTTFHSSGLTFVNAWGTGLFNDVSVFNNLAFTTESRDDVDLFAWSRASGSLLGGQAPCCVELTFSASVKPGATSAMVTDDTIPTYRLKYSYANVMLHTGAGWTDVMLAPTPVPEPDRQTLLFAGLGAVFAARRFIGARGGKANEATTG